jgi:hypothetical protein
MEVTNLQAFFVDSCYPDTIENCFTKESDLDRIKKNKIPLYMNEQELFSTKQTPFSFLDIYEIVFESFGNVLLINRYESEYCALRPCDTMEKCVELIGTVADRAVYKSRKKSSFGERESNANRPVRNYDLDAENIEIKLRTILYDSLQFEATTDILTSQKTQLASLFFDAKNELNEFYFSLLSGRYFDLDDRSYADDDDYPKNDRSKRSKRPLAMIYSEKDDRILFPALYRDDVFFVKGNPIKRKSFFKPMDAEENAMILSSSSSSSSSSSFEISDYEVIIFDGPTVSLPSSNKRFSIVVSSLCHLERFGHFPNEREIALEYQKQTTSIKCEENIANLRKSLREDDDDRPLPWTNLKRRGSGRISKTSTSDFAEGSAPVGLAEEIPAPTESPYDALKWIVNDICFYQGERFLNQTCDFLEGDRLSNEEVLFLSIAYAFFSGTLSDDSFNSIGLEYGHSRPSLDSYEWYLTQNGTLYYSRLKRCNDGFVTNFGGKKRRRESTKIEYGVDELVLSPRNAKEFKKPCFLEDIEMDVESKEEEEEEEEEEREEERKKRDDSFASSTFPVSKYSKTWTGRYTNRNKLKNRFRRNGDLLTDKRSLAMGYDENALTTGFTPSFSSSSSGYRLDDDVRRRRFYDPCVLRKYDGRGLFPVLSSQEELNAKKESNQIIFDSHQFVSEEGFFRMHDFLERRKKKKDPFEIFPTNSEKKTVCRFENEFSIPGQMLEMIDLVTFFLQYADQAFDIFSDAESNEDAERLSEYFASDRYVSRKERNKSKRENDRDPITRETSVRCVDYSYVCDEIIKTLIPEKAIIKKTNKYHESNPLWFQCCTFVCSKMFKIRTICLTYDNVPTSLDNIYFMLDYHQIRCAPNFAFCLGYVSPEERKFKYDVFDCIAEIDRVSNHPIKYRVYKVTRSEKTDPMQTERARKDVKKHLFVTKSLISANRFDNILDASVLFVINSGF